MALDFLDQGQGGGYDLTQKLYPNPSGAPFSEYGTLATVAAGGLSPAIDVSGYETVYVTMGFSTAGAMLNTDAIAFLWAPPGGDSGTNGLGFDICSVAFLTTPATAQWPLELPVRGSQLYVLNTSSFGFNFSVFGTKRRSYGRPPRSGVIWGRSALALAAAGVDTSNMLGPYGGPAFASVAAVTVNTARLLIPYRDATGYGLNLGNTGNHSNPIGAGSTKAGGASFYLPLSWCGILLNNLAGAAANVFGSMTAGGQGH